MNKGKGPQAEGASWLWKLRKLEDQIRDWILRWGYGSGVGGPRVTETDALLVMVRFSYVARLAGALFIFALWYEGLLQPAKMRGEPYTGYFASLLLLLFLTLLHFVVGVRSYLKKGHLPSHAALVAGASFDVLWLIAGYVISGFSAFPFPPLLILAIGFHGILLGVIGAAWIASLGSSLFFATSLWGNFARDPVFGASTQAAFLIGVGVVSALLGNRFRAAISTVRMLSQTLDHLAGYQREVLEGLPVGMLVFREGRAAPEVNQYVKDIVQLPSADAGEVWNELARVLPGVGEAVRRGWGEDVQVNLPCGAGEGYLKGASGGERWVSWVAVPREVPDSEYRPSALAAPPLFGGGMLEGVVPAPPLIRSVTVLVTDLTDRRKGEAVQRQAERFAAVAELSAGLAHEVRNPLAALRSSAEQLSEDSSPDEGDRRLLGIIVRESDRLNRLVSEFLDFARVGGGSKARVDMERLVGDAVNLAIQGSGAPRGVRVDVDVPSVEIEVDADLVYRVISNLLLNAVQFSPEGGRVEVRGEWEESGGAMRLSVRDEGPGIPERVKDRIFSPFVTTRSGGTGLGLAIAQRSASLLGGRLSVDEPSGGGSNFVFVFPVHSSFGAI